MPQGEQTLVQHEGEALDLDGRRTETAEESSTETKPEGETPLEGDNTPEDKIPFDKHPRWRKLYAENKDMKARLEELESLKSQVEEVKQSIPQREDVPEWFREAFGENPDLYRKYSDQRKSEREEMMASVREEMTRQSQEDRKWEDWVKTQLKSLEDDGESFDRNELMKFASDYTVVGDDGNIDFKKALDLMNKVGGRDSDAAKAKRKLVAVGQSKGDAEPQRREVFTPKDLRNKGWDEL